MGSEVECRIKGTLSSVIVKPSQGQQLLENEKIKVQQMFDLQTLQTPFFVAFAVQ